MSHEFDMVGRGKTELWVRKAGKIERWRSPAGQAFLLGNSVKSLISFL